MGSERASTTRRQERGEICCICRRVLGPPGERYCDGCGPRHKVFTQFFLQPEGWVVNFLEPDMRTAAGRTMVMREDTLRATIGLGGGMPDSEARNMLEYAIEKGRGGVTLSLTEAQYRKLKRSR